MKNNELLNTIEGIASHLGYADESSIRKTYIGKVLKSNHLYCLDVGVFLLKNKITKKQIKAFVGMMNELKGK